MQKVKLELGKRSYNIIIGSNVLGGLGRLIRQLNIGQDAFVITNAPVKNRYGKALEKALKKAGISVKFRIIPDTEKSKSLKVASGIIADLARYDKKKQLFIVAFGGGVVGDVSGFVASIYKRGIPYIQIPTTLLAQVDSAIGGKTAVDLPEGKNLVGAFYQPRLVLSDVRFLSTLSPRQIRAGLAEVIKHGLIRDEQLFRFIESRFKDILARKSSVLEHIVTRSSKIKAGIVSLDEREERALRTILNFGHTAGHAIEAAANYRIYNHGEAIALGMLVAAEISRSLKLIDSRVSGRIEKLIKAVGLPAKIKRVSLARIINAHYRDKKFIGKTNRFVLITGVGRTKIIVNIPLGIVRQAIKKRL